MRFPIPPFVALIIRRLTSAGHQAYIVGGALRDVCLKRPVSDWDVTTSAPREEIKRLFHDIKNFTLRYNTVTLVKSGRHYEVTPFRSEEKRLQEDLAHRDFTINAMAYDLSKKEILDPFDGRIDAGRKRVRAVNDPYGRFAEDPIRLLRGARFAAELDFRIEENTERAIKVMAPRLSGVATERIREELLKLLMSPRPSRGLNFMRKTGLLEQILPELLEGYRKRQNGHHRFTIFKHILETVDRVAPVAKLRLAALLHDIAKPRVRVKVKGEWRFHGHEVASADLAAEIMRRLRFSHDQIREVENLVRHHMIGYHSGWSDGAVRRLIKRVGKENIGDLLAFRRADILAHGLQTPDLHPLRELEQRVKDLKTEHMVMETSGLAIDGHTVMKKLGLPPGPAVGGILKHLLEMVTDNPELNTERNLTILLEQMKNR